MPFSIIENSISLCYNYFGDIMKDKILNFLSINRFRFIYLLVAFCIIGLIVIYVPRLNDEQARNREMQNNESGTSSLIPPPDTTKPSEDKKTLSSVETIGKYTLPTIPEGFHSVDTDTAKWNINEEGYISDWNNGLVIADDIGNEFVWIPVKDIESFEKKEGYYESKEQEYLENIKEADYYGVNSSVESNALYESIKKYQGFYIARYEAGIKEKLNAPIQDGTLKPLSQKDAFVWDNIAWGGSTGRSTDGFVGSDTTDGAVKVARSMYPNVDALETFKLPSDLTNETGAISTLVYGIEWDLTMEFLSDVINENNGQKFIENSIGMGNYEDTNGYKFIGNYSTKNICDLAGNVYEWTMESYSNNYRILRGGRFDMGITNTPSASMRQFALPNVNWYGFRVALYIK